MTTLDIEFYCFATCVIGFPIALALCFDLRRQLRKARANEADAILSYNDLDACFVERGRLTDHHKTEAEKWKGRAKAGEKSAQLFAKRLQDAETELDAFKRPARDARGHFIPRASKVTVS